ncbi:MAG TPA: hypothetical protein PKE69_05435 [Pyrinomonadaceae bacterium]|nr:hypothetical protein [Pyrinomonadaceae bacterium]
MMSKLRRSFFLSFAAFAVILQLFYNSTAQSLEASIKIESFEPPILRVEGKFSNERTSKNWTFLNSIAGAENLGEKISDFVLIDKNGQTVAVKKLQSGEYLAENSAIEFSYKIDLRRKEKISLMAHISWVSSEKGLLMLDDLLPQFGEKQGVNIKFNLPNDWKITANEKSSARNYFEVADIEKAVFFIGKNWREREIGKLKLLISDEWQFTDDEAKDAASEILQAYQKIFGEIPNEKAQVFIVRFPAGTALGNWEAETRGANIVILSSDMPFKNQSVSRIHEQFRHEFFHLWVPNNLALHGRYDWFYEGFALYQSLKTGVGLNRLRFEDFLDTLSRAYNLDNFQTQRISLIEASKNRWSGGNSQVYARGMLTAFLCDIAILKESKGKRDLTEVLREIYQTHRKPNKAVDGNTAILQILKTRRELKTIVEKYIESAENIEWQTDLEAVGIEAKLENSFTKLVVKAKLNGRQKDLLNELGYNNWRKLVQKSK